jgi:hypothetical protein
MLGIIPVVTREGSIAGCRSPKDFRRPFNIATRSFLNNRLRVCEGKIYSIVDWLEYIST